MGCLQHPACQAIKNLQTFIKLKVEETVCSETFHKHPSVYHIIEMSRMPANKSWQGRTQGN